MLVLVTETRYGVTEERHVAPEPQVANHHDHLLDSSKRGFQPESVELCLENFAEFVTR